MIHDTSRAYWFGASDAKYIMNDNHNSRSWQDWWLEKTGIKESSFSGNQYTRAGNLFERPILLAVCPDAQPDGQIILEKYSLRVNFDGWHQGKIFEIKTHKQDSSKPFTIPDHYWQQCQIQMFIYQEQHKKWFLPPFEGLELISYGLTPDQYYLEPGEITVDESRIVRHPIKYDKYWTKSELLPRLKSLSKALKKGRRNV